jgi:hypothetical protein
MASVRDAALDSDFRGHCSRSRAMLLQLVISSAVMSERSPSLVTLRTSSVMNIVSSAVNSPPAIVINSALKTELGAANARHIVACAPNLFNAMFARWASRDLVRFHVLQDIRVKCGCSSHAQQTSEAESHGSSEYSAERYFFAKFVCCYYSIVKLAWIAFARGASSLHDSSTLLVQNVIQWHQPRQH